MSHSDFMKPAIEVAATSPRLDMIKSRLRNTGLRPYDMRDEPNEFDPLLVDLQSLDSNQMKDIRRQSLSPTERPFIVIDPAGDVLLKDAIVLKSEVELACVPARLSSFYRKRDRAREVRLRAESIEALSGERLTLPRTTRPRLLFIGGGSPRFLTLQSALKAEDVDVVAAFTALTAHDYVRDGAFSAVLLDLDESSDLAVDCADLFGGQLTSFGIPTFVLSRGGFTKTSPQLTLLSVATEIIDSEEPLLLLAERLAALARHHQSATPLTADTTAHPKVHDRITGLFTADFLQHHLDHQIQETERMMQPLSFVVGQLKSPRDGHALARKHMPAVARILTRDLRQTDFAARMDWSTIGISLRGTPYAGAARLVERFARSLNDAALPLDVSVHWRIVEKRRYHTAKGTDLYDPQRAAPAKCEGRLRSGAKKFPILFVGLRKNR